MLSFERICSALEIEASRFAETIKGADMAQAVPTCPRWNLDKLVRHNGGAHRWARKMVEERVTEFVKPEYQESPADHVAYLLEGMAEFTRTLREAGEDSPVWTFTPMRTASFWARRMLHETVVHRADACITLGVDYQVEPEIAADCISERLWILSVGSSRPTTDAPAELAGSGETLHFHATDGGGEWTVRRTPGGIDVSHEHGKGDVALRGSSADLMLVLMRRHPPSSVEMYGDARLLDHWLEHSSF